MKSVLDFEKKYKNILENIEEWAYIRLKVGFYLKNKSNENDASNRKKTFQKTLKKLLKIKDIFYGFKNWFGRYEYLFFSDSNERRLIEKKYKDKIMDEIIDISNKKCLMLENVIDRVNKPIYTLYVVSENVVYYFAKLLEFIIIIKNKNDRIQNLLNSHRIEVKVNKEIKRFLALKLIYKIILLIYRPKKVFINCYYCRLPLVKACHELGIPIVDVQHGVISKEHFGYVSNIKIDKNYIADELLSFGENEKNINNLMIKKVYPIGSYYLTYLQNNFKPDKRIIALKKDYEYCIGISMQDQEWEYMSMINFVNKLANRYKNILFLIIPRRKKDYFNLIKEDNIKIITFLDCYNIIMHCDIHMTLYSSCALETPSLGIPNILVDVNNMATKYYEDLLSNYHTKIIKTIEEFDLVLNYLVKLNKNGIKQHNINVFVNNYQERIKNYFKGINVEK